MLEYLEPYIANTSPRIVPAWVQYVQAIETYLQPIYKRHILAADVSTPGIHLLRYILACVDWHYMSRQSNDYERYMFHVRFIRDNLENTFDHITTGFRFYNLFTTRHMGKVQEFIIPVEDSTINNLPFDKDWSYWIRIRPVRYLYHDSKELSFDIEKDRVRFYNEVPNYVIIAIDVVALVFKYWKYLTDKSLVETETVGKDQRRFIHKYVLNGFYEDQLDTFLIHQLEELSHAESLEEVQQYTINTVSANLQYGFSGLRYTEASRTMYRELMKIKSGNIRPSAILSSGILGYRKSIVQKVNDICNRLDVPRLRQYQFYRYLRDRDLFNFILHLFSFKSQLAIWKPMEKIIKPKIQRAIRDRIWVHVKDPIVRTTIEDELRELDNKLSYR